MGIRDARYVAESKSGPRYLHTRCSNWFNQLASARQLKLRSTTLHATRILTASPSQGHSKNATRVGYPPSRETSGRYPGMEPNAIHLRNSHEPASDSVVAYMPKDWRPNIREHKNDVDRRSSTSPGTSRQALHNQLASRLDHLQGNAKGDGQSNPQGVLELNGGPGP